MPPQDPFIGREILDGQFRILQKICSGGMGAVYVALQKEMNRNVAVKILHPKLANRKDLVSRFRREARAMSQLTHPNTVRVFLDGELEDGSLYIVMEHLEGRNLNQSMRHEGPFPMERALPLLSAVCGPLEEAPPAGITHPDLNIEGLLHKPGCLTFGATDKGIILGLVYRIEQGDSGKSLTRYSISLVPQLAYLRHNHDQQIFQHLSVPKIIAQVLESHGILRNGYRFTLGTDYQPRDYCVQYGESCLHFLQRLCEEEGLHYHFEHSR